MVEGLKLTVGARETVGTADIVGAFDGRKLGVKDGDTLGVPVKSGD